MEIGLSILLLVLGSYFTFLSKILTSISQDDISLIIKENYKSAQQLQNLKQEFDEDSNPFLLFEIASFIVAGILFGIFISDTFIYATNMLYAGVAYSLVAIVLRYVMMAFGMKYASKVDSISASIIFQINLIGTPLSNAINLLTKAIAGEAAEDDSRDEIYAMVEYAREDGSLEQGEYKILRNIMDLNEIIVSDVMTPRTVIFSFEADKTVEEVASLPEVQMYSRFPIWEGESIDDGVLGYVMSRDVIFAALNGRGKVRLRDIAREVYFIRESVELDTVLEKFLHRRQHLFIVVDKYGGVEGLITMEDVLESVLGEEIVDEADKFVDMRQLAKQRRDRRIEQKSFEADKLEG